MAMLDNKHAQATLITLAGRGLSLRSIAPSVGMTQQGISYHLAHHPDLADKVQAARNNYIQKLEKSLLDNALESKDNYLKIKVLTKLDPDNWGNKTTQIHAKVDLNKLVADAQAKENKARLNDAKPATRVH